MQVVLVGVGSCKVARASWRVQVGCASWLVPVGSCKVARASWLVQVGSRKLAVCKFGCVIRMAILPEEPLRNAMLSGKNWMLLLHPASLRQQDLLPWAPHRAMNAGSSGQRHLVFSLSSTPWLVVLIHPEHIVGH